MQMQKAPVYSDNLQTGTNHHTCRFDHKFNQNSKSTIESTISPLTIQINRQECSAAIIIYHSFWVSGGSHPGKCSMPPTTFITTGVDAEEKCIRCNTHHRLYNMMKCCSSHKKTVLWFQCCSFSFTSKQMVWTSAGDQPDQEIKFKVKWL